MLKPAMQVQPEKAVVPYRVTVPVELPGQVQVRELG